MTTNSIASNKLSAGKMMRRPEQQPFFSQMRALTVAFFSKTKVLFETLAEALHHLSEADQDVDVTKVYYVRHENQEMAQALGHAYIDAEASLLKLKQQRMIL